MRCWRCGGRLVPIGLLASNHAPCRRAQDRGGHDCTQDGPPTRRRRGQYVGARQRISLSQGATSSLPATASITRCQRRCCRASRGNIVERAYTPTPLWIGTVPGPSPKDPCLLPSARGRHGPPRDSPTPAGPAHRSLARRETEQKAAGSLVDKRRKDVAGSPHTPTSQHTAGPYPGQMPDAMARRACLGCLRGPKAIYNLPRCRRPGTVT